MRCAIAILCALTLAAATLGVAPRGAAAQDACANGDATAGCGNGADGDDLWWPGVGMLLGGAAVSIMGAAPIVLAELDAADFRDDRDGARWSPEHQARYDTLDARRIVGGIVLGVGLVTLVTGLVLMWIGGTSRSDRAARRPAVMVGLDSLALRWSL